MGIWTSNQPRTVGDKTYVFIEQNNDFQLDFFELDTAANLHAPCATSEIRTLTDEIPILMGVNDFKGYDDPTNLGQRLTLITKLGRGGRDVEIDKIWGQGIGRLGGRQVQVGINAEPFWGLGYYEQQDAGEGLADEVFLRRKLRELWQSNFGETLDELWAIDLQQQIFSYMLERNLVNEAGRAGQRELLRGRYWEDKAALMFRDRGFAVAAFKALLGIGSDSSQRYSVPGATLYYHKSRINIKGNLYSTKDGNRKISARYKSGQNGEGDWTNICANAIYVYNPKPPTENDEPVLFGRSILIQPSFIVELGDPLQSADGSYVEQDLFDALGASIPAGVTSWYNDLCDIYEEWYNAWLKGEAKQFNPPDDYKQSGLQLGGWLNVGASSTSPGVLYLGARLAFGKNNIDGSLWFGNWHFELTLNPRNFLSQAWQQLNAGSQTSRNRFVSNIQRKVQAASSGSVSKTPVGLDPNGATGTNNGTRPGVGANDGPVPADGTNNGVAEGGHSMENKPGDQIRENE
jgi:hypothetical protein